MKIKLNELAGKLDGKIEEGRPNDIEIRQVSPIETAREGSLTFLHNSKYNHYLYRGPGILPGRT